MAIARLEKPHCGNRAVPFMNRTTSFLLTMSSMRDLASLTVSLRLRHRGFELQCVKLSPNSSPERRIDRLVLADAAHSFKPLRYDACGIMVAVPGEIADRHLGVGDRCLDQPFDLARGHRHQRPSPLTSSCSR